MIHSQLMQALAYGDAFGLPYETRTKAEILKIGIEKFLIEPSRYSDFEDFQSSPIGTWSDDTQHALVVCESLEQAGKYSMLDIALRLKAEMQTALGWGKTTKNAIGRVYPEMSLRGLHTNGETVGNGCGPLMRSVPLVLYTAGWSQKKFDHVAYESTVLTHNNPENIACSVTHHQVLKYVLENQSGRGIVLWAHEKAVKNEQYYGARPVLSDALRRAMESGDIADAVYESGKWGAFTSWAVQAVCCAVYERTSAGTLIDLLAETVSEGGDADSTASIVASMWGVAHEVGDMPGDIGLLVDPARIDHASKFLKSIVGTVRR